MTLESDSNLTRLEILRAKEEVAKQFWLFCQRQVTSEIIIQSGYAYDRKANKVRIP